MEYIMEQLKDWKTLYLKEIAKSAVETAALQPLEPQSRQAYTAAVAAAAAITSPSC